MAKRRTPAPIMTRDEQRFMAFEGLVQWTAGVVEQGKRLAEVSATLVKGGATPQKRRAAIHASRSTESSRARQAHQMSDAKASAGPPRALCSILPAEQIPATHA
jgi:hypothetical protein